MVDVGKRVDEGLKNLMYRKGCKYNFDGVCMGPGPGEIDWKQLAMVVGSEALKFEAEQDATRENGQAGADEASHLFASPRGRLNRQCQSCRPPSHVMPHPARVLNHSHYDRHATIRLPVLT